MTAPLPRRTGAPVPRGKRLTGDRAAVAARITQLREQAAAAGMAVELTPVRQMAGGGVQVDVRFLPRPAAPRRRYGPRVWIPAAAAALVAVAGCGWLAVYVVQAVTRTIREALPYAAGVLVILGALVVASAVRGGGSSTFSGTFKGRMD